MTPHRHLPLARTGAGLRPSPRAVRREDGVAIVEFALVVPLVLLIIVIFLDFGRAINYWIDETHLANEGARLAAVDRTPGGGTLAAYVKGQAETKELREGGSSSVPGSGADVTICFPDGTQKVGDPVKVIVSTDYHWIPALSNGLPMVGSMVSAASKTIKAEATMRLERESSLPLVTCPS